MSTKMNRHLWKSIKSKSCWRVQKNVRETGKRNIEIFYVVSVCMSGEIILEYRKVGRYGPDRNQGNLFFVCLVGII